VLRALAHPVTFLGLLAGFLVAIAAHAVAQAAVARGRGDRRALRELRRPQRIIDPFGAVAAAVAGPGWGVSRPQPFRWGGRGRGRQVVVLLAGPAASLAVGATGIAVYLAVGGPRGLLEEVRLSHLLQGRSTDVLQLFLNDGQLFVLAFGLEALAVAVLSLVPLPPLTGWRILMLYSGRSMGWQRAREYLEERNFGVLALLLLLLIPLGLGGPLLLELIDWVVSLLSGLVA
jgi:Zn-dependent protease